jgi:hypothetical protein
VSACVHCTTDSMIVYASGGVLWCCLFLCFGVADDVS